MSRLPTLLFIVIITSASLSGKSILTLKQALEKKCIKAVAVCTGGLELNYTITNLKNDSLIISVPPGWRFDSNAGQKDYQDILVTKQELWVMKALETKKFHIKGYCCEAAKSGPVVGAPYTLGKMADSSLLLLSNYLNLHPFDQNTQQYAVWAISDKKETANITAHNDSLASMLRAFVATIKGEPLPWYTLLKRSYVSSSGSVNDHPVRFKATISYSVTEKTYGYCYIVDRNGQKVSEIFGKWLHPDDLNYEAHFKVSGLQKGEYKLILENKKDTFFERSFKI